MFALMEALGVFDPHLVGCHRRGAGDNGGVSQPDPVARQRAAGT